jgi:competence protein ComEC
MKTNGKLQLYPCLRVAMCLIAGIYVGDATAACVPLVLWQWLFVGLLAVVLLLYLLNRHAIVQTLILFGIMMAGGAWRIAYVERQQRYAFSGEEEAYEAVVVAQPIEKKRSFKCELAIVRGRLAGHKVNAYFQKCHTDTAALSLTVGDGITARSVFSHFDDDACAQRGGFSWRRQRMVRDIVARTFIASDGWKRAEVSVRGMTWLGRLGLSLQSLRQRLLRRLRGSSVSEDAYATIAAMTLGDKTALTTQLREPYSKAGVSHVLALSGLHLGIIYAMLALLLGRLRNTVVGLVSTITLIWLFALMVGMSPGIVRSAAMFTLYTSMSYLSREYLTLNSLAAAATIILVASPAMLWDVGFQMSFLAVLGISTMTHALSVAVSVGVGSAWCAISLRERSSLPTVGSVQK